jgi:hypothetical protein
MRLGPDRPYPEEFLRAMSRPSPAGRGHRCGTPEVGSADPTSADVTLTAAVIAYEPGGA